MSKHKRPKKVICQRIHAKNRFLERTGLVMTTAQLDGLVAQIQSGQATLIRKQSNRSSLWHVWHVDRFLRVAYDKRTHAIVTVLPQGDTNEPHATE